MVKCLLIIFSVSLMALSCVCVVEAEVLTAHTTQQQAGLLDLPPVSHSEEITLYVPRSRFSTELIARKGLLILRPAAKATVVVMHAYTSNKVDTNLLRLVFPSYNLLLFDFRGHGECVHDQCSTLGHDEVLDVFAAVDYVRSHQKTKDLPIIGYGFSMGASTAIEAQAMDEKLFDALVLDCPFDSSQKLVSRGVDRIVGKVRIPLFNIEFDLPGRSFVEDFAFNEYIQPIVLFVLKIFASMDSSAVPTRPKPICPAESSKKIKIPCFFITCVSDKTVPFDAVYEDFQNVQGIHWLWLTDGARHYGSIFHNPELYKNMVNVFAFKALKNNFSESEKQVIFSDVSWQKLHNVHQQLYAHSLPEELVTVFASIKGGGMKKFFYLFMSIAHVALAAEIKTLEQLEEFISPVACDCRRLSAVVFHSSADSRSYKRQRSIVKKVDQLVPHVQIALADISCPDISQAMNSMGIERGPALMLFKEGKPASSTVRPAPVEVSYGLGGVAQQRRLLNRFNEISDTQLKDFILSNFCDELREIEIERTEHAARACLLAERDPGIWSTGGRWPDWIAAFQPWPLYWG